jgi:hypothetical protein
MNKNILFSAFHMKAVKTVICDLDQCALWTSFCSWTVVSSKVYLPSVLRVSQFLFLFKRTACCCLIYLWFKNWGNNLERASRLSPTVLPTSCRTTRWVTVFYCFHFTLFFNSSSIIQRLLFPQTYICIIFTFW